MPDRAAIQPPPTGAPARRARVRATQNRSLLRTFGPPALLLFCALNLFWSQVGNWGVRLGGFHYSRLDSITVTKGLFSHDGRLYFANSCKEGMYTGIRPWDWESRPVDLHAFAPGAWFNGPYYGWRDSRTIGVRTDEWEHSGISHLGFVATWEPDSERFPQRGVAIPWWFLVAVFSLTPIKDVATSLLRMRRHPPAGARPCPLCHYDLRATPDRCPECGSAVA